MKKKTTSIFIVAVVLLFVYLYSHATPKRAIRANIFSAGNFNLAFSCEITKRENNIYEVSPAQREEATETTFNYFQVSKDRLGSFHAAYYFDN